MRLSRLTLSGFKSFAKTATLEFPAAVSAIVGPNGSGKSNVAEAIRWALGEQSLKTLRGKRGEDLIFSGSAKSSRMGRASVALTFDNHDRAIPLDFPEVVIERKIFRDGTNEYALNGSRVRLRDVVELIARLGLGETKHNIIGQGEVDHMLGASARERREILEEALGLRIWQLKKREAERRLEETDKNIGQVQGLEREIAPHLKFLKTQAEKAEKREAVRKELEDYWRAFVQNERAAVTRESKRLDTELAPHTERLTRIEKNIAELTHEIEGAEGSENGGEALRTKEKSLEELERTRRERERELGRIEGRLEAHPAAGAKSRAVIPLAVLHEKLQPIKNALTRALDLHDAEKLRTSIENAIEHIGAIERELAPASKEISAGMGQDLTDERDRVQKALAELDQTLSGIRRELTLGIQNIRAAQERMRGQWKALRKLEEEKNAAAANIQRVGFEWERLRLRKNELERMIGESGMQAKDLETGATPFAAMETEELKRKIEKLRVRLEEIGGIDPTVLKEYGETRSRHEFLERELGDLRAAQRDLHGLVRELETTIAHDFKEGFAKVTLSFRHYFRVIFGGGKGDISSVPLRAKEAKEENTGESGQGQEYGIEISVDLPAKRIKGLEMLSGGERALVSIALLFAITAVNPPPFLVLDETDAALDEANSRRYAEILRELSKKTQLVLITHNRETMKQAGILYGVTMGEDGISKMLSLKLEKAGSYGNQ